MRSNLEQVEPLMDLAYNVGASLKFLDLINMEIEDKNSDFWKQQYYHFRNLSKKLEQMGGEFTGYEDAPGGIGAPLLEYRMKNGLKVVLKDAAAGTYYSKSCLSCRFYPCQDALISLRVTHDGHLKRCLIRNDNIVNILTFKEILSIHFCDMPFAMFANTAVNYGK